MFFLKKKSEKERKEEIYSKFMKNKRISRSDLAFMRKIDWHPIDELNIKRKTNFSGMRLSKQFLRLKIL